MPSILGDNIDGFCKAAAGIPAPASGPTPVNFDLSTLIDSIRQFPDLVHKTEPGFANTYADPDWKNFLWRSSTLVPLGLAASGLAGLHYTSTKPQPKAKKKKPTPTTKTADLKNTLFNIRSQLPGLHPVDTAVGALGGAALGGLYDVVRGNSTRLPNNKRWRNTARRVLTGALLGGAGANLAGDRARRYVSNTLIPFGYDNNRLKNVAITPKQLKTDLAERWKNWQAGKTTVTGKSLNGGDAAAPDSLTKIWNAAVLDKQHYDPKDLEEVSSWGNYGGTIDSRREIMRRAFGVHANNPTTDWWQKNRSGYYSLNEKNPDYLQRLRLIFGPESKHNFDSWRRLVSDPQKLLTEFNTKKPVASQASTYDLFAGGQVSGDQQVPFAIRGPRIDAQALDRFDLTPSADENAHLWSWVKNKLTGRDPKWLKQKAGPGDFHYKVTDKTNEELAKTIGARWLWENVLSNELPWVSQKMTFTPNAPAADTPPSAAKEFPWALQFLRESGQPAGEKLTNEENLKKWFDSNPLAKEHELLTAIRAAAKVKSQADTAGLK